MFWVEEFQKKFHYIIINGFDRSGVWICNKFRARFKWKLLRVNLSITINNGMVIKYPLDRWNRRTLLGGEVLDLKWASVYWLLHPLDVSVGSSSFRTLDWFIFIIILGGSNLGPWMIQASSLCTILPQHSQIIFCLMRRYSITGWRVTIALLLEDEGQK